MTRPRELLRSELRTWSRSWTVIALVLLASGSPLFFVRRGVDPVPLRLLVAGVPAPAERPREVSRLLLVLGESSELAVTIDQRVAADPRERLERGDYDLLVNLEGEGIRELSIYTSETDPALLPNLQEMAAGILRLSTWIAYRFSDGNGPGRQPLFPPTWWAPAELYEDLYMLGAFPVHPAFEYTPQAADPSVRHLPSAMILALGTLPFALAVAGSVGSWRRRRRCWVEATSFVAVKVLFISGATILGSLFMLLLMEPLFGIHVKTGLFAWSGLLILSSAASASLGLTVARLTRSPHELALAVLFYVVAVALLSDPAAAGDSTWLGRGVAHLLPSTLIRPPLTGWIFGADITGTLLRPLLGTTLQAVAYFALAVVSWRSGTSATGVAAGETARVPAL